MRNRYLGLFSVAVILLVMSGCSKSSNGERLQEITLKVTVLSAPVVESADPHRMSLSFFAKIQNPDSSALDSDNVILCGYWSNVYAVSNFTDAAAILDYARNKDEIVEMRGYFMQTEHPGRKFVVRSVSGLGYKASFY
jgi:hypothetical protein